MVNIKVKDENLKCSAEGHVSHIYADRMSSRPLGWSKKGVDKMSRLRIYRENKGSMLELVRYQKKELPMAAGAEKQILLSSEIIRSERNRHGIIGKYVESINHSVNNEIRKCMPFKALLGSMLL